MVDAGSLLARAAERYDHPASKLPAEARRSVRVGFTSASAWMNLALGELRGEAREAPARGAEVIGFVKYGASLLAALIPLFLAWETSVWAAALLTVPAFYALEAQWVFAFPLALDGAPRPLRDARAYTLRAGGTLAVMRVVLPIAASMLFGGFVGRGFLRSWCLGCLAVLFWYESLREAP